MTLNAAISLTTDELYNTPYYDLMYRKIEYLGGIEALKRFVPYDLQTLRKAYLRDPSFNNLSMRTWTKAAGVFSVTSRQHEQLYSVAWETSPFIAYLKSKGITSISPSECVSLLKCVAMFWVESEE